MSDQLVQYENTGSVAVITMDDGKANALSPAMIEQLNAALDKAEQDKVAVLLTGRPARFSAGFDLRVMLSGPDAATALLASGAELFMRMYEFARPVVTASTGHAIAGGALLLATGDTRIGARGEFKIGLNEVQNSMPVPILAHRLAKDRLDPRAFVSAVLHATMYNPDSALEAGWLDRVTEPDALFEEALAEAKRLADLPAHAYALTKRSIRRETIDHIRSTLQSDFESLMKG